MEKEIITHEEASNRGLTRYFTGRACRNGHIADRYVNGGACAECINGDKILTDAQRESRLRMAEQKLANETARIQLAKERLEAKKQAAVITDENRAVRGVSVAARSEMLKIKIAIPYYDLPAMKAFVHGLASVRIPGVRVIDVCPNLIPKFFAEPVFIYIFMVHPEDRALVFQAQDEFMNEMKGKDRLEQIRRNNERIIQQLNDERDAEDNGDPGDTLENLMR